MHLEQLQSPRDLKELSYEELNQLAGEIRQVLIQTVSQKGGHLASNLGVVELTLALHRVFDLPEDKIVFDVGHQSYVHKLLTGRNRVFHTLRSFGGISGFPKRSESDYDVFETGHASTAISAALGLARARDFRNEDHQVIALVGDGALTGGLCYEALNDAGNTKTRMIVILNDNEMSIARNVGALSRHLTDLRISKGWSSTKKKVKTKLEKVPGVGPGLYHMIHRTKNMVKNLFVDEGFFTSLGFQYFGPINGHDIRSLEHILSKAKEYDGPAVIHVLTKKGYGYEKAEEQPEKFHGIPPFYVETGDPRSRSDLPSFGAVMAEELTDLAERDKSVVAISAAMTMGTGLDHMAEVMPERVLDVGIAEEHAATMAAGLAAGGMHPYFAVYATFFQRCYDQMIHDVAMQHLSVVFLLDRAGLSGHDGATHHGIYDFSQTLPIPGVTILAPRDLDELRLMIRWTQQASGPVTIRYGRDGISLRDRFPCEDFHPGKWEMLMQGKDCLIFAVGSMVIEAVRTADILREDGIEAGVVNCSSVKPMDDNMLWENCLTPWVVMEEHSLIGGFASEICSFCVEEELNPPILSFGIPEMFVQHGARGQLLKYLGLLPEQMEKRIKAELRRRGKILNVR